MAVLSREEFTARLQARVNGGTGDEDIAFLEDMTDTYNDLESRSSDTTDWKSKYDELDASWRKRYTDRFYNPPAETVAEETTTVEVPTVETVEIEEEITTEDLFNWDE